MKVKTTKTKRPPYKPNCAECSIAYGELKLTCDECWEKYYKEINQNEEKKMNNCLNCVFSRKKIDDLNIDYEGTEKVICLRHMVPIEEDHKCNMWIDQNKELKCSRCGKEIKFAIYTSKKPSYTFTAHYGDQAVEIYTGTDLCLDCHKWAEEQKEKMFGVGFDGLDSLF